MNFDVLTSAKALENELFETYKLLHKNAEVGFDLPATMTIIKNKLDEYGIAYEEHDSFITATIGNNEGKTFLLRADMDALPMKEESEVDYACQNGNHHACGHDMHTTMLIGASKILNDHKNELKGRVKILFQPAEELLKGADYVIRNGALENPQVDGGMMIHVMTNTPFETGTCVVSSGGVTAPSADYFEIKVSGNGCHGSSPHTGVDPVLTACNIVVAIQEITSREIPASQPCVITVGSIQGGNAHNIIPDEVMIKGTMRCFDEDIRAFAKKRIEEISNGVAKAFRAVAETEYTSGCPSLMNDNTVSEIVFKGISEVNGTDKTFTSKQLSENSDSKNLTTGSEDFAYISREIPAVMVALSAGKTSDGYEFNLHNPKVKLDMGAIPYGVSAFVSGAFAFLKEYP